MIHFMLYALGIVDLMKEVDKKIAEEAINKKDN